MIYVLSGGAGLNFKVVGGTSQPTNPKENTIWVNTDTAISSWTFSTTKPESHVEGMVWIPTGISSSTPINALKKNGIEVNPVSAKQYVSGVWVSKNGKIYKNGKWKSLSPVPAEYQEVEYLQSTGTQYIKTGLKTNGSYFRASGKFSFAGNGMSFGAVIDPATHSGYLYQTNSSTLTVSIGSTGASLAEAKIPWNTVVEYDFEGNGTDGRATLNGVEYTGNVPQPLATNELHFFGRNYQGGNNMNAGGKAWRTKWYLKKDVLTADFVPCYRIFDSVAGLYDVVNNIFYTNAGSGTFIVGADV